MLAPRSMKAIVLGAGRMGRAAAWDLGRQPDVSAVTVVDRDNAVAEAAASEVRKGLARVSASAEVHARAFDLDDPGLVDVLRGHDVALSSADYRFNEGVTRAAIEARVNLCDLGGNLFVVEKQLALDDQAQAAGITVVPDCGLAPGMACLLAALGVERCGGSADEVRIRVGGLPKNPKPPLNYKLVFSVRGLTNEYLEPAEVLRAGKPMRIDSLTDVEALEFPAPYGQLEAFNTSGGSSTLPKTLEGRVKELDYKTIRYPGHCAAFAGMASLGMFSSEQMDGVVPREFVETMIERSLVDDDTDVVLMRVEIVRGGSLVFELIDEHNADTGHSAMARTTAYPAAAVAHLLGSGAARRAGVLPGELALPLEQFLQAIRDRGMDVQERQEEP